MTSFHLRNVVAIMLGIACAIALQTGEREASTDKIVMRRETIQSAPADTLLRKDDPVQKKKLMRRRQRRSLSKAPEVAEADTDTSREEVKEAALEALRVFLPGDAVVEAASPVDDHVAALEEYDGGHVDKAHASQSKVKSASTPEKLTCAACNRYDYVMGVSRQNSCRNKAVEKPVN